MFLAVFGQGDREMRSIRFGTIVLLLLARTVVDAEPAVYRPPKLLQQALGDTTEILRRRGSCAEFYGDPEAVTKVLVLAVEQMRPRKMSNTSAVVQMIGDFEIRSEFPATLEYRIFPKMIINLDGSFFRILSASYHPLPDIGGFRPNSREVRILILLHELAHLILRDGQWLIPDDGHNPELSAKNTAVVSAACGKEIVSLVSESAKSGH